MYFNWKTARNHGVKKLLFQKMWPENPYIHTNECRSAKRSRMLGTFGKIGGHSSGGVWFLTGEIRRNGRCDLPAEQKWKYVFAGCPSEVRAGEGGGGFLFLRAMPRRRLMGVALGSRIFCMFGWLCYRLICFCASINCVICMLWELLLTNYLTIVI